MLCSKCGGPITEGTQSCPICDVNQNEELNLTSSNNITNEIVTEDQIIEVIDENKTVENTVEEVIEPQVIVDETNASEKGKNNPNLIIMVASCLVIVFLCFIGYMYATKTLLFKEKEKETKISTDAIISEKDYPRWDASTATQPLALAFYQNFTGNKDAKLSDFTLTKTHEAYVALINGEKDFIIVTSPSEDELALAKKKGVELEVTPVVHEAFVFFVSTDNKVDSLTQEQVVGIYTGKIKNWKEVGGEDKAIKAFQRPENSGSQTGMLDIVMKDKKLMEPISEVYSMGSMSGIVNAVSSYGGETDGIGYSYYYYVTTMYEDIDKDIADGIKLLAIDGFKPEKETIQTGTYPYRTAYYIVTVKGKVSENTKKVIDEMLSARGQKIAEDVKYVPVK
jgi:ABC-type phosphate transport system, periplasmic component